MRCFIIVKDPTVSKTIKTVVRRLELYGLANIQNAVHKLVLYLLSGFLLRRQQTPPFCYFWTRKDLNFKTKGPRITRSCKLKLEVRSNDNFKLDLQAVMKSDNEEIEWTANNSHGNFSQFPDGSFRNFFSRWSLHGQQEREISNKT